MGLVGRVDHLFDLILSGDIETGPGSHHQLSHLHWWSLGQPPGDHHHEDHHEDHHEGLDHYEGHRENHLGHHLRFDFVLIIWSAGCKSGCNSIVIGL